MSTWWYWYQGMVSAPDLRRSAPLFLATYSTHQAALTTGFSSLSTYRAWILSMAAFIPSSFIASLIPSVRSSTDKFSQSRLLAYPCLQLAVGLASGHWRK